jgi:hypothetical protein
MEEARAVLSRLERIEALEQARADPEVLLGELRELVREAEAWARRERDPRAEAAARRLAEHAIVTV